MHIKDESGQVRIVYDTEHESVVVTTPLEEEAFEIDNGKVVKLEGFDIEGT
jgi:hypothetical protein